MSISSKALVFFVVALIAASNVASSMAATYNVGDASGWTITGDVNYTEWASSKNFHAGDIIRFVYNPQFHNVLQVTSSDYESCTATAPLATYTTGNDSIPITGNDIHYYFICGVPNHCDMGQKVDIQVDDSLGRAIQAPSISPPKPTSPSTSSASSFFSVGHLLVTIVGATTYLSFLH